MDNQEEKSQLSKPIIGSDNAHQKSKRRLLQGMVAAPLVASLPARNSWGSSGSSACSISGMLSGNLSRNVEDYQCSSATGKSPGFWKTHPGCWPAAVSQGRIYSDVGLLNEVGCAEMKSNGKMPGNHLDYYYPECESLTSLLSEAGQSIPGFNESVMTYLRGNSGYPKHLTAALLSAFHPNTNYPYSAQEIASAALFAEQKDKTSLLKGILQNLQDGQGSANAQNLVVRCL